MDMTSPFAAVKAALRLVRHAPRLHRQKQTLRALASERCKRIVIGSSGTAFAGWVSTDREIIDLTRDSTWSHYFPADSLDAILAEHVWEHLTAEQALLAARTCFRYLRPGGYLRAAVPDGFHPDPQYIAAVKPGGTGEGSDDHKTLYNHESFAALFASVGFQVKLQEYFDRSGQFHGTDWSPTDGMIQRSRRYDSRNEGGRLAYTSVIVDAVKPDRAPSAG
jgi:predicted SAM-dependent methyltransferase